MGIIGTLPKIKSPKTANVETDTVINWSFGPVIIKQITGDTSFSFSNLDYSKEIIVVISYPTGSLPANISFPKTGDSGIPGKVLWPRGNPFCAVDSGESVVLSFTKNGNDIVAQVSNEQVRNVVDSPEIENSSVTHVRDFYMNDPSDTKYIISKWEKVIGSGSGVIGYAEPSLSGSGRGVLTFNGNCTYRLKDFIPVVPEAGIGGTCYFQMGSVGSCVVSIGFEAYRYDSTSGYMRVVPTGYTESDSTRFFLMYNNAVSSVSPSYVQEICFGESSSILQSKKDFYSDGSLQATRFIKPVIKVSSYVGGNLYLSGLNIYTANFSARGVYTQGDQVINGVKNFTSKIDLGTGTNKISLNFDTPTTGRVYTLTDVGANANFVMTEGAQTINGAKTFTSLITGTITNARYSS